MAIPMASSFAASFAALGLLASCAGKVPETRYYQLAAPAPAAAPTAAAAAPATTPAPDGGEPGAAPMLVLEPLAAEEAYQDERIVYRASPYRLDYYNYHRWSAPPSMMVSGYLEQALERSGQFRAVVRELADGAPVVLGGRLIAIEEIDESPTRWLGRVSVELTLKDAHSGEVLWVRELTETEPLTEQTQEGLARALSKAMGRIAARAIPEIATHARRDPAPRDRGGSEPARAASRAASPRGVRLKP
jgi:ABC-type uncharacterized transport system auxiliary subunit